MAMEMMQIETTLCRVDMEGARMAALCENPGLLGRLFNLINRASRDPVVVLKIKPFFYQCQQL